jgi:hypothetical protein
MEWQEWGDLEFGDVKQSPFVPNMNEHLKNKLRNGVECSEVRLSELSAKFF